MEWYKLLLVAFLILFLSNALFSQKSLDGIVKIEVYNDNGELLETGAGILAGTRGSQIFVVTAFHVIDEGTVFQVSFNSRKWDSFTGKIHERYNDDLDYGVLIVDVPPKTIKTFSFHQPDFKKIEAGNKIRMVGHPQGEDWTDNTQNVITNPQNGTFEIGVSNVGIVPGYSGGALLSKKKDHLIGLIVDVSTNNAIAVRIDQILRDLKAWGIPHTYILPYKPPRRVSSYIFAGLSVGATVGAVYFNTEQNRIYDIYSTQRNPVAPVYNIMSHEDYVGPRSEALQKAKNNQRNAYISAGTAIGSTVLSILLGRRKYKYQDNELSLLFDQINPSFGGANLGVCVKF